MNQSAPFQVDLIKLSDGTRMLRVSDVPSGTTLERRVDAQRSVASQKDAVERALRAVLERELKTPAAA